MMHSIIVSGYGSSPRETIAGYHADELGGYQKLWEASIENASFLCRGKGYLFAVTEHDDYAAVYMLKPEGGECRLLDEKRLQGGALCHIAYSAKNKALFGACYGTGSVFSIRVEENCFGEILYNEIQKAEDEKGLTRAHCVLLGHREDELLTVNIALDQIIVYKLDGGYPSLSSCISLPSGTGPRHAIYSEDEKYLYVITEYSNEIFIYRTEDRLLLQRVSTLPESYRGESYCSTLCFSRDGRFLYGANRGAETIVQFEVNGDGTLTWVEDYPCGGRHPRHMILSEDGNRLIICNQNSDQVVAFSLEEQSGRLGDQVFELEFYKPAGILG